MRVVLDTNVLISGIFWGGAPRQVLEGWVKGKFQVLSTKNIIDEYLHVLQKFDANGDIVGKWGSFIVENTILLNDLTKIIVVCRDPGDVKFLDCAIRGNAQYIVSGDDDLLSIKAMDPIKILKPTEFLKLLK